MVVVLPIFPLFEEAVPVLAFFSFVLEVTVVFGVVSVSAFLALLVVFLTSELLPCFKDFVSVVSLLRGALGGSDAFSLFVLSLDSLAFVFRVFL